MIFERLKKQDKVQQHGNCMVNVTCEQLWFLGVSSQRVQLVDGLFLVGPLQVQVDLLHQRDAVRLSDVQLLRFIDAVLLKPRESKTFLLCVLIHIVFFSQIKKGWSKIQTVPGGGERKRSNLWDDYVSQSAGQSEELQRVLQADGGVVLRVVLDAVVDVRDLADVVAAVLHAEVPLQLRPALQHQLQRLAVVQLQIWRETRDDHHYCFRKI